jgi:hypothetical protein
MSARSRKCSVASRGGYGGTLVGWQRVAPGVLQSRRGCRQELVRAFRDVQYDLPWMLWRRSCGMAAAAQGGLQSGPGGPGAGGSMSPRSGTSSAASRGGYGGALVGRQRAAPECCRAGAGAGGSLSPRSRDVPGGLPLEAMAELSWDGSWRLWASGAFASGLLVRSLFLDEWFSHRGWCSLD